MLDSPTWKQVYAPRGYLAVEGDWIKREAYGRTLETVAKHGADAFYHGEIANQMIDKLKSLGGVMTTKDVSSYAFIHLFPSLCRSRGVTNDNQLAGFKAIAYPPIHQTWNNKTVYTTAAPTSGGMLLAILNLVEGYDFPSTPESEGGCQSPKNVHRLLEAMKLAFGARSEVTDPAFASQEQMGRDHEFTTKEWAHENRHKITDVRSSPLLFLLSSPPRPTEPTFFWNPPPGQESPSWQKIELKLPDQLV